MSAGPASSDGTTPLGIAGRIAKTFVASPLTPLVVVASILLGIGAVMLLPREEEPQIVVPMVDVFVPMPGASGKEVEERVTRPMERLIWEIPGVEYVYSTTTPGGSMAIVRFKVGEDEERAIVRLNQKLQSNFDIIPPGASTPLVKPRSIDDVPILGLTLSSSRQAPFALRKIAVRLREEIKAVPDVSEVTIIGGPRRQVRALLDPARMAGRGLSPEEVRSAVGASNRSLPTGSVSSSNSEVVVETGGFLHSAEDVGDVVVGVSGGSAVHLREVADVVDGPAEPVDYVFFAGKSVTDGSSGFAPAVTLAVSKRKGTNATVVAREAVRRVEALKGTVVPADVTMSVTRDYGETAAEKSNELLLHMLVAVVSVSILIGFTLGWRESGVVATAIPVTLALTLAVFLLGGYTLNRVTLFALIFSIGILVDDAIVVVENVVRHYRLRINDALPDAVVAVKAVDEVGNPTILATVAVIAAIVPMAFVRGLMGPYMRPIPVGATAAMIFSVIVAFLVTPWASVHLLKRAGAGSHGDGAEGRMTLLYRRAMGHLLHDAKWRFGFLASIAILLLGACSLVYFRVVEVKMLPFDNKSEFQVVVDMPEGTTLETTASVAREVADAVRTVPEVSDVQIYAGTSSPYNFNGLVRHSFLRRGANVADIQVNLVPKGERKRQSHEIAKTVRPLVVAAGARRGANVKVSEVPPGPPVLQTLVAEVYGPDAEGRIAVARQVKEIFEKADGVVDVDWFVEDDQKKLRFEIDPAKASLHGISAGEVASTLALAVGGAEEGLLHDDRAKEDVPIVLRLPVAERSRVEGLLSVRVAGRNGALVPLSEIVRVREETVEKSIYHKNLMPVVYVTADVAGAVESPVYAILRLNAELDKLTMTDGASLKRYVSTQPESTETYSMKWDGEWHITYEVFRDLGLAFAAVLVLIYILVVGWFRSFTTPMAIMAAIPFSLIGILPAHGAMGAFFTATSMIGFIAGAGIVVRNSIILVDFIELRRAEGMPLDEAVIDAGAVRFRPMVLTAAAVVVGASVMLADPIFQGLAISLMAGEVASLLLSRMAVPVLYYMISAPTPSGSS